MLINKEPQLLLVSWHDGEIPQVSPLVTRFLFSGTTYHSDKSAGSGCCSTGDSYPLIQAALTKERYIFTDCPINRQTFNESNLKKLVSVYILYIVHVYTWCDQDTHTRKTWDRYFSDSGLVSPSVLVVRYCSVFWKWTCTKWYIIYGLL